MAKKDVVTATAQKAENIETGKTPVVAGTSKNLPKKVSKDKLEDLIARFGVETINLFRILKNNAEIRRFTSLGIINYLIQTKQISGTSKYVMFKEAKFSVITDGLNHEYSYTEPFFLNCFVASFSSFAATAQKTVDVFVHKTMSVGIEKAVDKDEVDKIVNDTMESTKEHGE